MIPGVFLLTSRQGAAMSRRPLVGAAVIAALVTASLAAVPAAPPGPAPFQPCAAPEARAFDFWHGDWTVNNRYLTEDGWVDAGSADVLVYPALGGCVTIEHWDGNLGGTEVTGFSARAWDANKAAWVLLLNWPAPNRSVFGTLEGNFRHGRGEFFSTTHDADGNEVRQRYSFADISADSFRWDQAYSPDGERWRSNWIMEYSRRDPVRELPVFSGPTLDRSRCDAPEYRQLDGLLGKWTVETEIARSSGEPKRQTGTLRSYPILQGCAIVEFFEAQAPDDEPFMAFRIRAWDAEAQQWVQYWYDTAERVFQRFEGTVTDDRLELEYRPTPDSNRIDRITWTGIGSDSPEWSYELSLDGGNRWGAHAIARHSR
jgi:hypothetical protein